ncbi:MAG: GntR family transcriptional regulator [Treponema sp.]|nr:GntR family transcriptional regulator [Treponema sp.]
MDLVINNNSSTPIYLQLYSQISSQILNGSLQAGSQLPSIRTIAKELRISVIPVKMAWDNLDKEGFIKTLQGRGTFVAKITNEKKSEKKNEKVLTFAKEIYEKAKSQNITLKQLMKALKNLDV